MARSVLDVLFYFFNRSTPQQSPPTPEIQPSISTLLYREAQEGRRISPGSVAQQDVEREGKEEKEEEKSQEEEKTTEDHEKDRKEPSNGSLLEATVKIQAYVRGWRIRRLYKASRNQPSICDIRRFAHLLGPLDATMRRELELLLLKGEVAEQVRLILKLKDDLTVQDRQISMLANGKRMLKDLLARFPKLKQKNKHQIEEEMSMDREKALELRKRTERLEAYENLFYRLQTQPMYLAKLICHLSKYEHMALVERVLLNLYDHASTPREEYHLLKLLKSALQHEVESGSTSIGCMFGGRSKVMRTIFTFYRQSSKFNVLLQKLAPVIKETMTLKFRIQEKPSVLCHLTSKVMEAMSVNSIPYGIRYLAKVLRQTLGNRYLLLSEELVVETLGLFLNQFVQVFIGDPHEFGLCNIEPNSRSLEEENLIVLAMLVGHTMTNTFFPVRSHVDVTLNQYIQSQYGHFWRFFKTLVNVPEPEETFDLDYYSEMMILKKPVIVLPAKDIVGMHDLLLDYKEVTFPDEKDAVFKILKDLGPVPDMKVLLGEDEDDETGIHLSLSSKCLPQEVIDTEREMLVVLTKKFILDVIRVQPGKTLCEVLLTPASPEQEEEYATILRNTTMSTNTPAQNIIAEGHHLSLEKKKMVILTNIKILLHAQIGSQDFLNDIAMDLLRTKDLSLQQTDEKVEAQLRQALDDLHVSSRYYQSQIECYQSFQNSCLEEIVTKKSSKKIQCTVARLERKGVIDTEDEEKRKRITIEIEGRHQIKLSAGETVAHLGFADIINLHYSSDQAVKRISSYDFDLNLLLFMVYSKIHLRTWDLTN